MYQHPVVAKQTEGGVQFALKTVKEQILGTCALNVMLGFVSHHVLVSIIPKQILIYTNITNISINLAVYYIM